MCVVCVCARARHVPVCVCSRSPVYPSVDKTTPSYEATSIHYRYFSPSLPTSTGISLTLYSPLPVFLSLSTHIYRYFSHSLLTSTGISLTLYSPLQVFLSLSTHLYRYFSHSLLTSTGISLTLYSPLQVFLSLSTHLYRYFSHSLPVFFSLSTHLYRFFSPPPPTPPPPLSLCLLISTGISLSTHFFRTTAGRSWNAASGKSCATPTGLFTSSWGRKHKQAIELTTIPLNSDPHRRVPLSCLSSFHA